MRRGKSPLRRRVGVVTGFPMAAKEEEDAHARARKAGARARKAGARGARDADDAPKNIKFFIYFEKILESYSTIFYND